MSFSIPHFITSKRHFFCCFFYILTYLNWRCNEQSCLNLIGMGSSFFVVHKIIVYLTMDDVLVSYFHHSAV